MNKIHIHFLDGIRGVAVLLVLMTHMALPIMQSDEYGILLNKLFFFLKTGWTGVDLFFVLSGLLITKGLIDAKNQGSKNFFINFFAKRFLRIFPLYYLFLVILKFLLVHAGELGEFWESQISILPFSHFLFYIQNFSIAYVGKWPGPLGITWSLAIEEHFYLIWPFLVYYLDKRRLNYIILLAIIGAMCSRLIVNQSSFHLASYVLSFCRMDTLLYGAFIAINYHKIKISYFRISTLVSIFTIVLIYLFLGEYNQHNKLVSFLGYTMNFLFFGGIISLILKGDLIRFRYFFEQKILRKFGKYSYAIYLIHAPINGYLHYLVNDWSLIDKYGIVLVQLLFAVTLTLISFILGKASYYLIEIHFLKLKKYFLI